MSDPHAKHWLADDANFMATVGDLDRDLTESPERDGSGPRAADPRPPLAASQETPSDGGSKKDAAATSRAVEIGDAETPEVMTFARRAEAEPHGPRRLLNLFPESALEPVQPDAPAAAAIPAWSPSPVVQQPHGPSPPRAGDVDTRSTRSEGPAKEEFLEAIRERSGFVLLTGPAGTGKTTLCRAIVETLDRRTVASLIPAPSPSFDDLLTKVLVAFGVMAPEEPEGSGQLTRPVLISTLNTFLESLALLHASAVVFIDEADALPVDVLAGLDAALAPGTPGARVLQLVLVGRPALITKLQHTDLQALNARITRRVALVSPAVDEASVRGRSRPIPERVVEVAPIDGEIIDYGPAASAGRSRPLTVLTIIAVFALLVLAGAGGALWLWRDAVNRAILEWQNVPSPPAHPVRDFPAPVAPIPPPVEPGGNLPGHPGI